MTTTLVIEIELEEDLGVDIPEALFLDFLDYVNGNTVGHKGLTLEDDLDQSISIGASNPSVRIKNVEFQREDS
jgi:hypothetical protein